MGFEERGTSDQHELLGVGIDIKEGDNELKLDQTLEVGGALWVQTRSGIDRQ